MNFIVYKPNVGDPTSGPILRTGRCPDAEHIALQAREGEAAIEDIWGNTDDRIHCIENGDRIEFTPAPPPPLPIRTQRATAYPPIGDQLDALWHAMDAGVLPMVPEFYDPIKAVKDLLPKLS